MQGLELRAGAGGNVGAEIAYRAEPDGSKLTPLTRTPGYDAEATISEDGKKIVFISDRTGAYWNKAGIDIDAANAGVSSPCS